MKVPYAIVKEGIREEQRVAAANMLLLVRGGEPFPPPAVLTSLGIANYGFMTVGLVEEPVNA